MNYPPTNYTPGAVTVTNGMASRYAHAVDLDQYATWLATMNRWNVPALIGHRLTNANTFKLKTSLPHYCDSLAIGALARGKGHVDITCTDDTYGIRVHTLGPNAQPLDEAIWRWATDRFASVSDSVQERAFDTTDQASPHEVTITITPSLNAQVWAVVLRPMPRSADIGALP